MPGPSETPAGATALFFPTFLVMFLQAGGDTHVTLVTKDFRFLSMGHQPPPMLLEVKCHFLPALPPSRGLAKPPAHFLGLEDKGADRPKQEEAVETLAW